MFNNDKIRGWGGDALLRNKDIKLPFTPCCHLKSPKGVYQLHPLLRSGGWLSPDTSASAGIRKCNYKQLNVLGSSTTTQKSEDYNCGVQYINKIRVCSSNIELQRK
jgi:hypothetical protein